MKQKKLGKEWVSMDKKTFKASFINLLEQNVIGLSSDEKVNCMKKWIRDYQQFDSGSIKKENTEEFIKVGLLVRKTIREIVRVQLLPPEKIILLQDERYCKNTFDINYPFLKKVVWTLPLFDQRKVNGYDRYWADPITINNEKFLICNDWYERNRPKFLKWKDELK
jgi:hypothetical protein